MKRILIVEDDDGIRESLEMILQDVGFEVATAKNGLEALEVLDFTPDLILLDLMMPVMDGYGFAEALQETECASVPVVVMTALAKLGPIQCVEVISKPVDLTKLLKVVQTKIAS